MIPPCHVWKYKQIIIKWLKTNKVYLHCKSMVHSLLLIPVTSKGHSVNECHSGHYPEMPFSLLIIATLLKIHPPHCDFLNG